jgi:hypothetical protein
MRELLSWRCLYDLSKTQRSEGPNVSTGPMTYLANEAHLLFYVLDRILRLLGKSCSRDPLIRVLVGPLFRYCAYMGAFHCATEALHRLRRQRVLIPPACTVITTKYNTQLETCENTELVAPGRISSPQIPMFPRLPIFTQLSLLGLVLGLVHCYLINRQCWKTTAPTPLCSARSGMPVYMFRLFGNVAMVTSN